MPELEKMKKIFRQFLVNFVCLYLLANIISGIRFVGGFETVIIAGLVLTLINLIVKPLINLLLLPINLLTLGTFRWLVNVISLYLVTLIIPQFEISGFVFPGLNYRGLIVPSITLTYFWTLITVSFLISLFSSLFLWIMD